MINKVLVVVNKRCPGGSYPDFDIRQTKRALEYTDLVKHIDVIFDSEQPSDLRLLEYCELEKPDMVLLCLQGAGTGETRRPTVVTVSKIKHDMNIPVVVMWFDTHSSEYIDLIDKYGDTITLNLIGGSDPTTHKPIKGSNYVYCNLAYDESYFNLPDSDRDIDIGFLGTIKGNRPLWIKHLAKNGLFVYTSGGQLTPSWMPFEEYCQLTSRFKIAINFASLDSQGIGSMAEKTTWVLSQLKTKLSSREVLCSPSKIKSAVSSVLPSKMRSQVRSRIWEAMWLGACVFEEDNPVTAKYFMPYVDYIPYKSADDLVEKLKYYLSRDSEREQIAKNGHDVVLKYYNVHMFFENVFEASGVIPSNVKHQPGEMWNVWHYDKWLRAKDRAQEIYINGLVNGH